MAAARRGLSVALVEPNGFFGGAAGVAAWLSVWRNCAVGEVEPAALRAALAEGGAVVC